MPDFNVEDAQAILLEEIMPQLVAAFEGSTPLFNALCDGSLKLHLRTYPSPALYRAKGLRLLKYYNRNINTMELSSARKLYDRIMDYMERSHVS